MNNQQTIYPPKPCKCGAPAELRGHHVQCTKCPRRTGVYWDGAELALIAWADDEIEDGCKPNRNPDILDWIRQEIRRETDNGKK